MWTTFRAVLWHTWRRHFLRRTDPVMHRNGIPVGLYPGDPILPENISAIFDFIDRHGQSMGSLAPGETKGVQFRPPEPEA